jgi:TRAP-type C4-dicarboxylate transport system permease small subunit
MARRFESLYRSYGRFLSWLGVFSGAITFGIMWLIVANSLMRKGFNHPIQGTYEITESCLVLLVFLSIAYTQCRRGHIRVILFTRHLPMAVQHWLYIAVLFIACLFFAWCAYAAWGDAVRSYNLGEQEWGLIRFPLWPVKGALFAGVALLSLQFLLDTIRHAFVIRGQLLPIGNEP